ncbi:MAG: NAD(P)/FAD-dependent oxidoreductase [Actinomycetota bacterium]
MTTPLWDDLLTDQERAALDPGPPDRLDPTPDVLVVGGGVTGLMTALFCRRAGIDRVTVLEQGRLGDGPSGRAAGTLTPGIHALVRTEPFVGLAARGLELHDELDKEWGGAAGFKRVDSLVALPAEVPAKLVERTGAKLVDGVAAREIEPEFGEVQAAVHIPRQGAIRPLSLIAALASRAGAVATGVEVTDIERTGNRVTRVRTTRGDMSPGAVVLATGTVERLPLPQLLVKGHMLATEPAPFRLRTLPAGIVGLVQTAEGHIVAGGTFDPGDEEPELREGPLELLVAELQRLVPKAKELEIAYRWTCFRPAVADELPIIDLLPDHENVWTNAAHFRTGIMVAPAAAELVAEWITSGYRTEAAKPFGLTRTPG